MFNLLIVFLSLLCVVGLVVAARKCWYVALLLLTPIAVFAQGSCDKTVTDLAGMLGNNVQRVEWAANDLINQGADVRVVTLPNSGGNLDIAEREIEKNCISWHNADGIRKSTLLVLMVSKDRKLGIYYGSTWHNALDKHFNRIKQDYMVPRFRDGDYASGFIAAEQQLAARLQTAKSETLTPVTQQTVNQPTDFSGLWKVFGWIVGLGFAVFIVVIISSWVRKFKKDKDSAVAAQRNAAFDRNTALKNIEELEDKISTKEALNETIPSIAKSCLEIARRDYEQLAKNSVNTPDTDGLSKIDYDVMAESYRKITGKAMQGVFALNNTIRAENSASQDTSGPSAYSKPSEPSKPAEPSKPSEPSKPYYSVSYEPKPEKKEVHHHYHHTEPERVYVPPVYTPPVVIVNNDNDRYSRDRDDNSIFGAFGSSRKEDDSGGGSSSFEQSIDIGGGGSNDISGNDGGGGGSSDF